MTADPFSHALAAVAADVNAELDRLIPTVSGPEARVVEAMRYAVLDGGKRFRAFLVCAGGEALGVDRRYALRVAAALEMVHGYSLVHDDLPAMDDDDLRRGRATVHRQFDEATAILCGDALQTLAFEVLVDPATHPDAQVRTRLVSALARAAGAAGMVGGQMIDLQAASMDIDAAGLERLQALKTGALIACAAAAGAILAGDRAAEADLAAYGGHLGLAFQVNDDVLDVEGSAAAIGKATQKDAAAGKATFVSRLGLDGAKNYAKLLVSRAKSRLDRLGPKADLLRAAADFAVSRRT
ncbi:MAG: polyprenyl synthetase family protein [Rhodospirillaceae bacterium]|nr:polyprenyl synthetase family protein [Rhodospirillaceae bacterium]